MKTVVLHGAKAVGRVVRVDDGDYDFVMQHRWHVQEKPGTARTRPNGPYAAASHRKPDGKKTIILMHTLLTGWPLVDHADHDGLNNQRYNLREATAVQNGQNSRRSLTAQSQFKGITWDSRDKMWLARIYGGPKYWTVCSTPIEIEAAYAYDAAAREMFGEFACTNFPEGPTDAMREHWRAEREARSAALDVAAGEARRESRRSFWAQRQPQAHVCEVCGNTFLSKTVNVIRYCGGNCKAAAHRQRKKEREGVLS